MRDNLPDQALHHRFVRFPTKRSLIILITFQSDWTGQRQVQCPVTQIVATADTTLPPNTRKSHIIIIADVKIYSS